MGARIYKAIAMLAVLALVAMASAQTTVKVGTVEATPDSTVRVPVVIEGSSAELVGINVRLTYDDSILSNPQAVAANAGDTIDSFPPASGEFNVVAYNLGAGRGANFPLPAPGGTAFYVDFDVAAGATVGDTADIEFNTVILGPPDTPGSGVSDGAGVSVTHTQEAGAVDIVDALPTPTATPTPTVTPPATETITPTQSATPPVTQSITPTVSESPSPTPTGCPETIVPVPTDNLDTYYDVKVRPKSIVPVITQTSILINDPNSEAVVKIKPVRGGTVMPMIHTIATAGSFKKLGVKDASVQNVTADKQIKNMYIKNGYARYVQAGEVGKVKMFNCEPSDTGAYRHSSVVTNQMNPSLKAKGQFLGCVLTVWDTPYQQAMVKVQSKKYRDRDTRSKHVALGQVSPQLDGAGDPIPDCPSYVQAAELKKLQAKGGPIMPEFVWSSANTNKTLKVDAKAGAFKLDAAVVAYAGDIIAESIMLNSRGAQVKAKGGDIMVYEMSCAGSFKKIQAQLWAYRDATRTKVPIGGFLGFAALPAGAFGGLVDVDAMGPMVVAAGYGADPRAKDINQLCGDTGVDGLFYAGSNAIVGGFEATCEGRVKKIKTQKPGSRKLPAGVTPEINGEVQQAAGERDPKLIGDKDAIAAGRLLIKNCEPETTYGR